MITSNSTPKKLLHTVGCGAEAAIGELTRLTRLDLSIVRAQDRAVQPLPTSICNVASGPEPPELQLQLLGCSAAAETAGIPPDASSCDGSIGGGSFVRRNTGLQDLNLVCKGWLSDGELAAAAAALPDLRQLSVSAGAQRTPQLRGLFGAGLAAFSVCRRMQCLSLWGCIDLEAQQLVAQLPQLRALASLYLSECPRLSGDSVEKCQAAFQAENLRHLHVQLRQSMHRFAT